MPIHNIASTEFLEKLLQARECVYLAWHVPPSPALLSSLSQFVTPIIAEAYKLAIHEISAPDGGEIGSALNDGNVPDPAYGALPAKRMRDEVIQIGDDGDESTTEQRISSEFMSLCMDIISLAFHNESDMREFVAKTAPMVTLSYNMYSIAYHSQKEKMGPANRLCRLTTGILSQLAEDRNHRVRVEAVKHIKDIVGLPGFPVRYMMLKPKPLCIT
eukprot:GHVO01040567.1.p1 GENE.GHVO01040567.1~~GHVO01040567.1.p1  ORF type:complete len:216 (-),score=33.95 GHVO01040567.1:14-661(-)